MIYNISYSISCKRWTFTLHKGTCKVVKNCACPSRDMLVASELFIKDGITAMGYGKEHVMWLPFRKGSWEGPRDVATITVRIQGKDDDNK